MKIAFLFLTIGDINFPDIWEYYFMDNWNDISIYCHSKHPEKIKTKWLKNAVIENLVSTDWGHLTNAYISLLKTAMKDDKNTKFMYVSDSCIPVKPLCQLLNMFNQDDIKTSYMQLQKSKVEMDDHNIKNSKIDNSYIDIPLIKHSGWFCLSRYHAELFIKNDKIYKFNKIIAGDENILSVIYPDKFIKNFEITYADWEYSKKSVGKLNEKLVKLYEEQEKNKKNNTKQIFELKKMKSILGKHPNIFTKVTNELLNNILNTQSFFYRKFSIDSDINKYYKDFLGKKCITSDNMHSDTYSDTHSDTISNSDTYSSKGGNTNSKNKIAFLFLTIDNVNFPNIWKNYFKGHEGLYSIYCHPKYPEKVTIPWMKNNIIPELVETGWGFIVAAYYNLLKYAYNDKDNIKFITISESCIPLVPFMKLYEKLNKDNKDTSYIKFMKISGYDMDARIKVNVGYDKYNFVKHYARFCLSRHHTNILLNKKEDMLFFSKMHIGDEFFLSLLQPFDNVEDFAITYDNWDYVKQEREKSNGEIKKLYKRLESENISSKKEKTKIIKTIKKIQNYRNDFSKNPKLYKDVTENDIEEIKNVNSFFWRKFPVDSNIEKFYYPNKCCLKMKSTKINTKYVHYKLSSLHGSIKHYFHFFYGVFIPLLLEYIKYSKEYSHVVFIIDDDLGPMLRILLELPIDIKLKTFMPDYDSITDLSVQYLQPMDFHPNNNDGDKNKLKKGWAKKLTYDDYDKINHFMKNSIDTKDLLTCTNAVYDIIIIERKNNIAYTSTYYDKTNKNKDIMMTSGSDRRQILNHTDLIREIQHKFNKYSVKNISLEHLSIFSQYWLFSNAKIVIAQHGASLSNILFMKKDSILIEIISKVKLDNDENWFKPFSEICKIKHYQFITETEHTEIDIDKFIKFTTDVIQTQ